MKKLIVGDIHTKTGNVDLVKSFFTNISRFVKDNDIHNVKILGDVYNQRAVVRTDLQRALIRGFASLVKHAKVDIIVGNHDYDSLDTKDTNSLEIFPWLFGDKISVYNKITLVGNELFVPYIDEYDKLFNELNNNRDKIIDVYCHVPINGFLLTPFHKETRGVPPNWFSGIPGKVFAGHFHGQQTSENIIYPGSLFVNSFAEAGMVPVVMIYDDETKEVDTVSVDNFVDNLPLYFVFNIYSADDINRSLSSVPLKSVANIKFIVHSDSMESCKILQDEITTKIEGKSYISQFQYKTKEVKVERISENLTTSEMFRKYVAEHDGSEESMKNKIIERGMKYLTEVIKDADL